MFFSIAFKSGRCEGDNLGCVQWTPFHGWKDSRLKRESNSETARSERIALNPQSYREFRRERRRRISELGFNVPPITRSYGDGTSGESPIVKTGEDRRSIS